MFFMVIPLKNFKLKTFYPWRIPSSKPFTPEEFQAQNPLPLMNSKLKTFYPWRIPSWKPFTPEEFQALKNLKVKPLYPWRIPSSKPFTPEEFQAQNPLPLKNSKLKTLYLWRIPSSKNSRPPRLCALKYSFSKQELILYSKIIWSCRHLLCFGLFLKKFQHDHCM
jgi:hypothetical protein